MFDDLSTSLFLMNVLVFNKLRTKPNYFFTIFMCFPFRSLFMHLICLLIYFFQYSESKSIVSVFKCESRVEGLRLEDASLTDGDLWS